MALPPKLPIQLSASAKGVNTPKAFVANRGAPEKATCRYAPDMCSSWRFSMKYIADDTDEAARPVWESL